MKIDQEDTGIFVPKTVKDRIESYIVDTLEEIKTYDENKKFIVNNLPCYKKRASGKITRCVMNSANFLSNRFQAVLQDWDGAWGETSFEVNKKKQKIDGLIEIEYEDSGYFLKDSTQILSVASQYINDHNLPESSIYRIFPIIYGMYCQRDKGGIDEIPDSQKFLFAKRDKERHQFRVGVEFETGNISSCFRALHKLSVLFQEGHIDAGVLIMPTKKCADLVWPKSNRNGTIEELEKRWFRKTVQFPLFSWSFCVDDVSPTAPFIDKTGVTYRLTETNETDPTGKFQKFQSEIDKQDIFIDKTDLSAMDLRSAD